MEKLNILPVDQQFDRNICDNIEEYAEQFGSIYSEDDFDWLAGRDEQYCDAIAAMGKTFFQFLPIKDTYTSNVVMRGICFTYDLGIQLSPPGSRVGAKNLFNDLSLQNGSTISEVYDKMTIASNAYLQHRQSTESLVDYCLPYIDPEDQIHPEMQAIIAYVLLHIELNGCDQFIEKQAEEFGRSLESLPDDPLDW